MKFKFKVLPNKIIHSGNIGLKGGGNIKIEVGRNMNDFGKIVPIQGTGKTEEPGNWTCKTQKWDAEIINNDTAILNPQLTKIYVGCVYDFTQIANGSLNTVPHPRKPMTLVTDNVHAKKAQVTVNTPSAANVQSAILELIGGAKPGGSLTTGTTFDMFSEEDFFMRTGGSGYYLGFGGSHEFNFKDNKKTHKYVVEVYQTYYTIFVDDSVHEPQDFFHIKGESQKPDAIDAGKINPNWVYVDSVSYGRMLYLVYESDYSFSEFGIDVNVYANIGFAGGEASLNEKQKKVLQSTSLTVGAVGGNPIFAGLLSNPSSFKDLENRIDNYFKQTNDEAKIAFTLSTLDQATVGTRMITNYTSRQCSPRASKYRVTWDKIVNSVNDDPGSGSEIKAFVRVAANGNGKFIMDVEKKNKALAVWVDLPAGAQKMVPKPWTFTEGSSANPLELSIGGKWNINKRLDFNIPWRIRILKLQFG